ncbi:hypothetical protein PV05_02596 [Exophiala xenobiotica]|uniref:Uncharacterized protein n=1 Tax=Exophiala xenobiotica TaxID=348802 RepID=A0A0D2C017_9EURO|nr:uncharacterized protein PV05_02596 [Exophiala xenobiotica]KIW58046.1 hypothetical protein PV05_02596 [Exophiala xenobiotica]
MAKAAKVSLDDIKYAAEAGYVDSFKGKDKDLAKKRAREAINKDNGDDTGEDNESIELSSSDEEDRDSDEEDEDIELSSSDEEDDTDDTDDSEDSVYVTTKTKRVSVTRSKKTPAATKQARPVTKKSSAKERKRRRDNTDDDTNSDINKRRKATGNHRSSRTKGRVFKAGKLSKSK